jgi:hypothetical protein
MRVQSPTGNIGAEGYTIWLPVKREVIEGEPDEVILPAPFTVNMPVGDADIVVESPQVGWVWQVTERFFGQKPLVRYLMVPDQEEVDYADLVEVDSQSLPPTAIPESAWWAVLEAVRGTTIEKAVEAGESALAAAEQVALAAGEVTKAEGHVAATLVHRNAASGSATAAAGSATAAQGSANAAATTAAAIPTTNDPIVRGILDDAASQSRVKLDKLFLPSTIGEAQIPSAFPRLQSKLILGAQPGHSWVDTGSVGGSTALNDTVNFLYGSQSVSRTSNGAGGASRLQRLAGPANDFTDRHLSISMELENLPKVGLLTVYAASGDLSNHHFKWDLKPPVGIGWFLAEGRWATLTLNFAEAVKVGNPNQAAITDFRITATDDNTGQPVTLRIGKVDSIPRGTRWPNGVFTLSMDDSFASQMEIVRYAANFGIRCTLYTIAELVGQPGYLTETELRIAQDDLGAEIGAHALTVNAHNNRLTSLSPTALDEELSGLSLWLRKRHFLGANHFCYPAGIFDGPVLDAVKRYFPGSARGTFSQAQEIAPPVERHLMRAKSLGASTSLAQAKASVDLAYVSRGWSHLYGHIFGATAGPITWTVADAKALIDYVVGKGIDTATVGEVLSADPVRGLRSPNGTLFALTVGDDGALTTTAL